MGPVYHFLGLSVGRHHPRHALPVRARASRRPTSGCINLRPVTRAEAYAADITYGTNNEFGFDYLRDNMVDELEEPGPARALVRDRRRGRQHPHRRGADAADHLGPGRGVGGPVLHVRAARAQAQGAARGRRGGRRLLRRPQGQGGLARPRRASTRSSSLLGIPNLYDADPRLARHFDSALKAHALYKRDRDYIVEDGEIVIVDEFTGRKMPGRRWSEGLHQAIEAKEGLRVQRESRTLATITFQNYFRLYDKLAGMTGTAMTEAEEFHKIYNLEVVAIPTHRPMVRDDLPDLVYKNEASKFNALIDEIEEMTEAGRPGPRRHGVGREVRGPVARCSSGAGSSTRRSTRSCTSGSRGVVAQAGRTRRRHDRHQHGRPRHGHPARRQPRGPRVGHPPQARAQPRRGRRGDVRRRRSTRRRRTPSEDHEVVVAAGGLHIIGTERHESRRIDNQLRGRAGRQGDPGSSRFYLSLDDDLMKRFASDRVAGLMERLGLEDDVAIESQPRVQDDRERPEPRRGLQLRHPQARRRVRRRHQQAARDDLRRARQGPAQRGPDRDRPRVPRRRGRRHGRAVPRRRCRPPSGASRACRPRSRDGHRRRGHDRGRRSTRPRLARRAGRAPARARRRRARGPRQPSTATRSGRRSSGSCCCGRSTACGSSTSPSSTTCAAASASAATRSRIR